VSMAVRAKAWTVVVPHDARGARLARQQLGVELEELIAELDGLIDAAMVVDAVAVVGELLGNAVRHAAALPGGVIRLECRIYADLDPELAADLGLDGNPDILELDTDLDGIRADAFRIHLRVIDGGANQVPAQREAEPDSIDGRGLAIVDALALRWGVERDETGQCVWAELGPTPKPA